MKSKVEAILFASGEPVKISALFKVLGKFDIDKVVQELLEDYKNRAITILKFNDKLQLCTKPEYADIITQALEEKKFRKLSNSALEVLAIIAYNEPITRVMIDNMRGIDSIYTVSTLVSKGFIESCGTLDVIGRPTLYKTTDMFLRVFGIESLKDLPPIQGDNRKIREGELCLSLF